jgi:iron-sulfur cluster assembly accessory protein
MTQLMTLTDSAAEQIKSLMSEQNFNILRIGVTSAGCSGLGYMMEPAAEPAATDTLIEDKGVKLVVDMKSQLYLAGMELDYIVGQFEQGFVFKNPNETGRCGCGKSFSTN